MRPRLLRRLSVLARTSASSVEPRDEGYVFRRRLAAVAAGILAAVEGGILPPGMATLNAEVTTKPARQSTGQDPSSVESSRRSADSLVRVFFKILTDHRADMAVRAPC